MPSRIISALLNLLYVLTLAVSSSMLAKTFGEYGAVLLGSGLPVHISPHFLSIGVIVVIGVLNMIGPKTVGKAEGVLVAIKLVILCVLIVAGLPSIRIEDVMNEPMPEIDAFWGSLGLSFFAFAGFGMMANAASDVKNPQKTIPKAIFVAIGIVLLVYVALSIVVLGAVSRNTLYTHADIALAEAARPILGEVGFAIVSLAALLATASGINAMLYSITEISFAMGKARQLPAFFVRPVLGRGTPGIIISLVLIAILTAYFDLRDFGQMSSGLFFIFSLSVIVSNVCM